MTRRALLLFAMLWPSVVMAQSQFGNQKVQSGTTCPPVAQPLSGNGTLYTCEGGGALYTWDGSSWVAVTGGVGLEVGTTTIAGGSTLDVLYNNAGVLGSASNLTVNLTGFVSAALEVARTSSITADEFFVAQSIENTTVPDAGFPFAESYGVAVYDSIAASNTADIGALYGITTFVTPDGAAGADYTAVAAYYGTISTTANGANIPGVYGYFIDWGKSAAAGAGTWTTSYAFYSTEMSSAAAATNMYYLWLNSDGVYRIREDNTFNSVYQAIATLYNPQFTKYTPGAANFERCIPGCQWNSNVAEIGNEVGAGGGNVLRDLRFIGQDVIPNPTGFFFLHQSVATAAPAAGDCDAAAETNRVVYDSTNDNVYVCSGLSGWRKIATAAP